MGISLTFPAQEMNGAQPAAAERRGESQPGADSVTGDGPRQPDPDEQNCRPEIVRRHVNRLTRLLNCATHRPVWQRRRRAPRSRLSNDLRL